MSLGSMNPQIIDVIWNKNEEIVFNASFLLLIDNSAPTGFHSLLLNLSDFLHSNLRLKCHPLKGSIAPLQHD